MKTECQYCGELTNAPIIQDEEIYCSTDCAGIVRFDRMIDAYLELPAGITEEWEKAINDQRNQ